MTIKREDVEQIKTVAEKMRNAGKCYCSSQGLCVICRTPANPQEDAEEAAFISTMADKIETNAFDRLLEDEIDPSKKPS